MAANSSLDPADWPAFRQQAHRMLDDILDYLEHIRGRPVWQPIPEKLLHSGRAASRWAGANRARLQSDVYFLLPCVRTPR